MTDIMHNQVLIGGVVSTVVFVIGWACPNDKLYKIVKPLFIALKAKFGKFVMKTVAEKIDAIDKAAEDVANEDTKIIDKK